MRLTLLSPLFILFSTLSFASPETTTSTSALLSLKKETQTYHQTEEEKRAILSQLYILNSEILKMQREQDALNQSRRQLEIEVTHSTQIVSQLTLRIDQQRTRLAHRLQTLQQFGGQGALQILFTSQSATNIGMQMHALKKIAGLDYEVLRTFRHELADRQSQQTLLTGKQAHLTRMVGEIQKRADTIAAHMKEKSHLLSQIDSKQMLRVSQMRRLRLFANPDLSRKLANLESVLRPSFIENRGQLTRPFKGVQVESFGAQSRAENSDSILIRSHGIVWKAESEHGVAAVSEGIVIFSGPVDGFGQTVIVDHGEHYYSVYSQLDARDVTIGQHLAAGESLGQTDKLYFEIRHFSDAEDPNLWLRR